MPPYVKTTLAPRVASYLAGRPVVVRWERPRHKGRPVLGLAESAGAGEIVTVDPTLSGYEQYRVFLHEVAHARLHWTPTPPSPPAGPKLPPNIQAMVAEKVAEALAEASARREAEADALSLRWARWARAHAQGDSLGERLEALLRWTPTQERT
jgi:hypothetical protein